MAKRQQGGGGSDQMTRRREHSKDTWIRMRNEPPTRPPPTMMDKATTNEAHRPIDRREGATNEAQREPATRNIERAHRQEGAPNKPTTNKVHQRRWSHHQQAYILTTHWLPTTLPVGFRLTFKKSKNSNKYSFFLSFCFYSTILISFYCICS